MHRVALVDGHQMFLDVMSRLLVAAGLDVLVAVSRWSELIAHPGYPADVVIMNVQLQDGVPVADRIRHVRAAGGRVVVIAARAEAGLLRACLATGAHGFVVKADDAATLAGAVHAAVRGRQYLSPRVAAELRSRGGDVNLVPALSPQEARTLSLYSSGLPLKHVARVLGVRYETAKSYLDRVRVKYAAAGRPARTKVELRGRALEDGHLAE